MKKHIWLPLLSIFSVWIMVAGIGSFAAAMMSKSMNATVNIVGSANFSYYSDQAATQPITSVTLPDVSPGSTSAFTVYVKNTGTGSETITSGTSSVSSTIGTLAMTFNGSSQQTLAVGAVSKVVGTLNVSSSAPSGPATFTFAVNAGGSSGGSTTTTTTGTGSTVSYSATIQPFFNQSCTACHGSSGGVTLTSYSSTMASTYNGTPVVVAGNATGSRLYQAVNGGAMAGYAGGNTAAIQALAAWINQGAPNN